MTYSSAIVFTEPGIREACARASRAAMPSPLRKEPSLEELLTELEVAANLPLERAVTLSGAIYSSREFFEWECRNVLAPEWQCVAHISQIPTPGDFLSVDLLGEPLVVVHGKDGQIRVLSRVCPHRAMDILPTGFERPGAAKDWEQADGKGSARLFLCPYHSWTFELDGSLKACPEMHLAEGFCRDDVGLKAYRSEVWKGFVFVNLDGAAAVSMRERLGELDGYLDKWQPEDAVIAVSRVWDCPFDWKVLVENFMESYHHAGAHIQTLQVLMPAKDTWTERERPYFVRCHLPYREKIREEIRVAEREGRQWDAFPPLPGLTEEERFEWGLVLGFPSFLLATAPDSLVWYRVQPLAPGRMRLLTTLLVPREVAEDPKYPEWLAQGEPQAVQFHLEDMECCAAVQRGCMAPGFQRGRLSHLEMPIWLFHRYLAARARGTWPAMDRPAAPGQR